MFWIVAIIIILIIISSFGSNEQNPKSLANQFQRLSYEYRVLKSRYVALEKRYAALEKYKSLAKYAKIPEAETTAEFLLQRAKAELQQAHSDAEHIILEAQQKARELAGNALDAKENAVLYEQTATAMKNIILGYGSDYLIPSQSLLDDLADTYGFTQASKDYKAVRTRIRNMVKNNQAATCDYAESSRKQTAIRFIVDAFNGKAESILAKAKSDNFGVLLQKLTDAFTLVNFNGRAFRNARILDEYFQLRIEELRLACVIAEIRRQDIEEQRRIREQIREEAKARSEIEKALQDAAKEEAILQKAIEKVRTQLEMANAAQKEAYEAQIAELQQKYLEAEERNKRALSMAQQTKAGHVYIISNQGSFGPDIYKIGMTRRLEPLDRIKELNSASVPFSFEVHAMIWSEDAPALENMLHKKFALAQVNKVNFRKEFFRLPLSEIRSELENFGLNVTWTITSQTSEYLESLAIEQAILNDPQAKEDWLLHQLELQDKPNFTPFLDGSDETLDADDETSLQDSIDDND